MKHVLSLHIPDTMDDWGLTIQDVSVYSDIIPVSCLTLQILLPGFKRASTFDENSVPPLEPNFTRTFTACSLGVQTQNCGTSYDCLPDGIYVIRLSVSPNEHVYAEYNHLRMVQAWKKYYQHLCDLNLNACQTDEIMNARLKKLRMIQDYLNSAKAQAQICHNPTKAMELYTYAVTLLDKLDCKSC